MAASKYELRAASYEATDLQSRLPLMAAGRCVIRAIRFQDSAYGSIAVTVSSSRVQRSGGRCAVGELANLVSIVAKETQADKSSLDLSPFLTQPVKTQNPFKGELSHGIVEEDVQQGVQAGRGAAAGARGFPGRGG